MKKNYKIALILLILGFILSLIGYLLGGIDNMTFWLF